MPKSNTRRIRAELHTHSTASDGQHSPGTVAELCARRGVEILSLTDHDSVEGCEDAAFVCQERGVAFLTGIEVSARLDRSIHVLGYGVRLDDETFRATFRERRALRATRMARMIERAQENDIPVTLEDVEAYAKGGNLARPHLARALVACGAASSMQDAFDRWLGDDRPLFIESPWPTVPEAIAEIHAAGGVAVLAHPGLYGRDEHIEAWIEQGLDGVEVIHPQHDTVAAARYGALARAHGLLQTASSDFHGAQIKPGQVVGECWVERGWVEALLERVTR